MQTHSPKISRHFSAIGEHWVPLTVLLTLYSAGAIWSWRKWTDILVDFGRELYIPWQITMGKVLYRDIDHLFGPLSHYFNALLFELFGVSYTTLVVANLSLSILFIVGLYLFLVQTTDRTTAFLACTITIVLFFFSQYTVIGNYNYVTPYAHEATHGLMLSFVTIVLLWQSARHHSLTDFLAGAIVFGLVLLTKAEVAVAAGMAVMCYMAVTWRDASTRKPLQQWTAFLVIALLPTFLFFIYLSTAMPVDEAASAMIRPWSLLANSAITNNHFYRVSMGLAESETNLPALMISAFVILASAGLVLFWTRRRPRQARLIVYFAAVAILLLLIGFEHIRFVRALPVVLVVTIAYLVITLRSTSNSERTQNHLPLLMLAVFSLFLLSKIILNVRIVHYGFYLALPAVVMAIIVTVWLFPRLVSKSSAGATIPLLPLIIVILALSLRYLLHSHALYEQKTFPIGADLDRIIVVTPVFWREKRASLLNDGVGRRLQ